MSHLTFWGVQGSCAGTNKVNIFGCNTSCLTIETNNQLLILDAGTGIRPMSMGIEPTAFENVILVLTHAHWDHIQGFPFLSYLFRLKKLHILTPFKQHYDALLAQLNGFNFPLQLEHIPCELIHIDQKQSMEQLTGINIDWIQTNHQGTCFGYRLKSKDIDCTYIPDNQLHYGPGQHNSFETFVQFCANTNILIHDSQYTQKDMPEKINWGHSIFTDTLKLGVEANTEHTVLFHHDPERTTSEIESMVDYCNANSINTTFSAAKEADKLSLLGNRITQ